ncbi:MAG: hypothetical protein LBT48_05395 [Prevotellaceae bacterium]|jgi:hypothetical protein|nr:hypothetical protein [Prevotellaceae bacterium]
MKPILHSVAPLIGVVAVGVMMNAYISGPKEPQCESNCADIIISGKEYTVQDSIPISNAPIGVEWFKKSVDAIFPAFQVASGKTEADGTFKISVTIDSTFFKNYRLKVTAGSAFDDPNYTYVGGLGAYKEFGYFNYNAFQKILLTLYQYKK